MPRRDRYHGQGFIGRPTRARSIVQMLQLAVDELDAAKREIDVKRVRQRQELARRMVADALVAMAKARIEA